MPVEVWQSLRPHLTELLAAIALVLAGWVVGRYLGKWSEHAASALLDRVGRRGKGAAAVGAAPLAEAVPGLVNRFVYWLSFLFFAAAGGEMLGLPVVSSAAGRAASYLPGAAAGFAIVLVGLVVASLVGGITAAASASAGTAYAGAIGRTVQGLVLILAVLIALEQIGIQGDLLIVLLAVVIGVILAGAALAFGLGARTAVSNIVGSYYVAQTYRVGQTVRIGEYEGRIVQTTPTAVVLDTRDGQVLIPARLFTELPSVLISEIT
jgi:small-conductance mechanosensitive channel